MNTISTNSTPVGLQPLRLSPEDVLQRLADAGYIVFRCDHGIINQDKEDQDGWGSDAL